MEDNSKIRFLRKPEVLNRLGVSASTLYRWTKFGRFPEPVEVGPRVVAWIETEVDSFQIGCAAERALSDIGEL